MLSLESFFYKFDWQDFDNQYFLWWSFVVKLVEFHGNFPLQ